VGAGRGGARPTVQGGLGGGLRCPRPAAPTPPLRPGLPPAARPRGRRGRGPGDLPLGVPPDRALRAAAVARGLAEHHRPADRVAGRGPPARPAEGIARRAGWRRRGPCDLLGRQCVGPRRSGSRRRSPGCRRSRRPSPGGGGRHRRAPVQVPRCRRAPPRHGLRLRGGRPRPGHPAQHVQEPPPAGTKQLRETLASELEAPAGGAGPVVPAGAPGGLRRPRGRGRPARRRLPGSAERAPSRRWTNGCRATAADRPAAERIAES